MLRSRLGGKFRPLALFLIAEAALCLYPTKGAAAELAGVYSTGDFSARGALEVFKALGRSAAGRVAVKVNVGEADGVKPEILKELVRTLEATIVDSNSERRHTTTKERRETARKAGYTALGPVDILDAEGDISLPVEKGVYLKELLVGSHYRNYDFFIIVSRFKMNEDGSFDGAIKNMSVGLASPLGKQMIYSNRRSADSAIAEAAEAVARDRGARIAYINVCDFRILSSLDPVALDKASVGLSSGGAGGESTNGRAILDAAEKAGLGSQNYKLSELEELTAVSVQGIVRLVGNVPFTELVITDSDNNNWYIEDSEKDKLFSLQQKKVSVKGNLREIDLELANGAKFGKKKILYRLRDVEVQ